MLVDTDKNLHNFKSYISSLSVEQGEQFHFNIPCYVTVHAATFDHHFYGGNSIEDRMEYFNLK
jgi:hypothetical protein